MKPSNEGSRKFDIVCMSFGKELEKGIKEVQVGKKDTFLMETMEIKVGNCTARDMNFSKDQMKMLIENREVRKTTIALSRTVAQR